MKKQEKCSLHNRRTDWTDFRELVNSTLCNDVRLRTEEDIISAVEHFNTTVQNAVWESTPFCKRVESKLNFYSNLEKVSEKRRLRKRWQMSRCPSTKTRLNRVTKELKQLLNDEKNLNVQQYLQQLDASAAGDYSLWKTTRKLKQPKMASPLVRKKDDNWARNEAEKAQAFAAICKESFHPICTKARVTI